MLYGDNTNQCNEFLLGTFISPLLQTGFEEASRSANGAASSASGWKVAEEKTIEGVRALKHGASGSKASSSADLNPHFRSRLTNRSRLSLFLVTGLFLGDQRFRILPIEVDSPAR